jgi:hypothetical protein
MKKNIIGIKGWLEIRDYKTKELLQVIDNAILDIGLAMGAFQLITGTKPLVSACIGSGSTAVEFDDTALETQLDAQSVTPSRVQTAVANDTAQFVSVHTAGAGGWAVKEYGIKDADGKLFNHVVFSVINLAEAYQLEFTYKVQVQRVA